MQIGSFLLPSDVILAPMAGVTDAPFRAVCRTLGAGLAVAEMVSSKPELIQTEKTVRRYAVDPEDPFPVVQILGSDPEQMAQAARRAEEGGAAAVDVNFGCPARVVCGKECGSALMQNEKLAGAILHAVKAAVSIPVTVKMRTGWNAEHKNALTLASIAQDEGYSAVTIHGRTRADRFVETAEYDTIAAAATALCIPVVANGDIVSAEKALEVKEKTKAAALMVGRASYGNPWIFREIRAALKGEPLPALPGREEVVRVMHEHAVRHFAYWGEGLSAVRSFRKHALWYAERLGADARKEKFCAAVRTVGTVRAVLESIDELR